MAGRLPGGAPDPAGGPVPVPWPAQQWAAGAPRPALPARAVPDAVADRVRALFASTADEPVCTYVYRPEAARRRAAALRARLPGWAEVYYAVKANSYLPVLAALAPAVDGFDVASSAEADAALAASGGAARMIVTGPGKSDRLLAAAVRAGAEFISVESEFELHRVDLAARRAGRRVPVVLRVNSASGPLDGALRMDGRATQFGVGEDRIAAVAATARRLTGVVPVGYHFHVVSGNLDADRHADHVASRLRWAVAAAEEHHVELRVVDVGGGLGVPAVGGAPFDLERFADRLRATPPPPGVRVVFEPGRWLVAECGWYAAPVTDLKRVAGEWFAVLGGGINHFMLPALLEVAVEAAVLPVERWPYPCRRPELRETPVSLAGPLCTPEDILARGLTADRLRVGDALVFPMAGAYGWEFAVRGFLGHPAARRVTAHPTSVRSSGTVPARGA
ncbi:alanine racemase [Streptomyces sp. TS71-3]|uniref:alanine racemase n=1 Tax=Streptomyces sp. TS71-3 TaxID=2733862 RepID=UPI001B1CFC1B|nr:alanine racemase [Streptomyces sp. TS71-3]GHJ37793.1 staphyloferrin B biosynthesis decarboxylase SbnH [Streptomyces sp. TS71-3]